MSEVRKASDSRFIQQSPMFARSSATRVASEKFELAMANSNSGNRRTNIPKVNISIDHLRDAHKVVKKGLDDSSGKVHFTVFAQCQDPFNNCASDAMRAKKIDQINDEKVQIGIHTLSLNAPKSTQLENTQKLYSALKPIDGSLLPMSLHGSNARLPNPKNASMVIPNGKIENQQDLSGKIRYIRSTNPDHGGGRKSGRFDIPVVANTSTPNKAEEIIKENAKFGKTTYFFFHANEILSKPKEKALYNHLIKGVTNGDYQSVPFPK